MRHFLHSLFYVSLSLSVTHAQEKTPPADSQSATDPNAWSVRTYRFPSDQLSRGFTPFGEAPLRIPAMPAKEARENEVVTFIKRSTDIVNEILYDRGFPSGTLFAYDRASMTLAVRANGATHDALLVLTDGLIDRFPQYTAFNLSILEADADVIRDAVKDASTQADHRSILARLEALADQGQAKRLDSMKLETRSGQRVAMTSAEERQRSTEFIADEKGNAEVAQEMTPVGTTLEIEPVIGPDGKTLDVNYVMKYHYAPPTLRWEPANLSGSRLIELRATDFHTVSLSSAITLVSDTTKLLGVWDTEAVPGVQPSRRLQIAFLRGCIVSVLPAADNRVGELLKTFGGKAEPTPTKHVETPSESKTGKKEPNKLPHGMFERRFRVPTYFFSVQSASSKSATSVDPFASDAVNGLKADGGMSPSEILVKQGITFPEGALFTFIAATSEFVVRNTQQNLDAIQAYLDDIREQWKPESVAITLQVVQADAAFIRKLESETLTIADHHAAWTKVEAEASQGRVKILRTVWIESRSGQRSEASAGDDLMVSAGLRFGTSGSKSSGVRDATKPDSDEDEMTFQALAPGQFSPLKLTGSLETNRVGTVFEVDPVIESDGVTVALNLSLSYDYAEPTVHHDPVPDAGKTWKLDAPTTSFHKTTLTTAATLTDGMTRLVGVWKPETLADGQDKDVLQAAFIRVNLIDVEKKAEK